MTGSWITPFWGTWEIKVEAIRLKDGQTALLEPKEIDVKEVEIARPAIASRMTVIKRASKKSDSARTPYLANIHIMKGDLSALEGVLCYKYWVTKKNHVPTSGREGEAKLKQLATTRQPAGRSGLTIKDGFIVGSKHSRVLLTSRLRHRDFFKGLKERLNPTRCTFPQPSSELLDNVSREGSVTTNWILRYSTLPSWDDETEIFKEADGLEGENHGDGGFWSGPELMRRHVLSEWGELFEYAIVDDFEEELVLDTEAGEELVEPFESWEEARSFLLRFSRGDRNRHSIWSALEMSLALSLDPLDEEEVIDRLASCLKAPGRFKLVRRPSVPRFVTYLQPPEEAKKTVPEEAKVWIKLRVVDDESDQAISGVKLELRRQDGMKATLTTGPGGKAELSPTTAGRHEVTCDLSKAVLEETLVFVTVADVGTGTTEKPTKPTEEITGKLHRERESAPGQDRRDPRKHRQDRGHDLAAAREVQLGHLRGKEGERAPAQGHRVHRGGRGGPLRCLRGRQRARRPLRPAPLEGDRPRGPKDPHDPGQKAQSETLRAFALSTVRPAIRG
jgi:hypothetical protein